MLTYQQVYETLGDIRNECLELADSNTNRGDKNRYLLIGKLTEIIIDNSKNKTGMVQDRVVDVGSTLDSLVKQLGKPLKEMPGKAKPRAVIPFLLRYLEKESAERMVDVTYRLKEIRQKVN